MSFFPVYLTDLTKFLHWCVYVSSFMFYCAFMGQPAWNKHDEAMQIKLYCTVYLDVLHLVCVCGF